MGQVLSHYEKSERYKALRNRGVVGLEGLGALGIAQIEQFISEKIRSAETMLSIVGDEQKSRYEADLREAVQLLSLLQDYISMDEVFFVKEGLSDSEGCFDRSWRKRIRNDDEFFFSQKDSQRFKRELRKYFTDSEYTPTEVGIISLKPRKSSALARSLNLIYSDCQIPMLEPKELKRNSRFFAVLQVIKDYEKRDNLYKMLTR